MAWPGYATTVTMVTLYVIIGKTKLFDFVSF